jgi:hypothetical protein
MHHVSKAPCVKSTQERKHRSQMVETDEGNEIAKSAEQSAKASRSIVESLESGSKPTTKRGTEKAKHDSQMTSIEGGIQIDETTEQRWKPRRKPWESLQNPC